MATSNQRRSGENSGGEFEDVSVTFRGDEEKSFKEPRTKTAALGQPGSLWELTGNFRVCKGRRSTLKLKQAQQSNKELPAKRHSFMMT